MHDYKTILKYLSEGKSQRFTASVLKISRNTVSDINETAAGISLDYERARDLSNEEIEKLLYPDSTNEFSAYLLPDYEAIHAELLKPGVHYSCSGKNMWNLPVQRTGRSITVHISLNSTRIMYREILLRCI